MSEAGDEVGGRVRPHHVDGDHRDSGWIQGPLLVGRRAATSVRSELPA